MAREQKRSAVARSTGLDDGIVRAHWRRQWCPKTEEHRPLLVHSFINAQRSGRNDGVIGTAGEMHKSAKHKIPGKSQAISKVSLGKYSTQRGRAADQVASAVGLSRPTRFKGSYRDRKVGSRAAWQDHRTDGPGINKSTLHGGPAIG
jgi:hypothetical protein